MKGAFLLLKEGFLQSKGKKDWKDIEWKKCYWMTACCMGKNEQLEWCVHALLWACVVPSCCCCCRCSVCACCTLNDTQNFYAFIRPFLEVQNETKRHTDTCGTGLHEKRTKIDWKSCTAKMVMFGRGFESRRCKLDGHLVHFFTLICFKNCIVCLQKPNINEKEAGVSPFL